MFLRWYHIYTNRSRTYRFKAHVKSYGCQIDSDHFLVMSRVRAGLSNEKKAMVGSWRKYNINLLYTPQVSELYSKRHAQVFRISQLLVLYKNYFITLLLFLFSPACHGVELKPLNTTVHAFYFVPGQLFNDKPLPSGENRRWRVLQVSAISLSLIQYRNNKCTLIQWRVDIHI